MTETVGYWCDECRRKYVRHKCNDGLPCGHDKNRAIYVYAKNFGRGGEKVYMGWHNVDGSVGSLDTYISRKPEAERKGLIGMYVKLLWFDRMEMLDDMPSMDVGEWIKQQDGRIIRAFLERWQSRKEVPDWRILEMWPDYLERQTVE